MLLIRDYNFWLFVIPMLCNMAQNVIRTCCEKKVDYIKCHLITSISCLLTELA